MTDRLPKPIKRKGFTARDVAAVFIKSDGRCATCHEKVALGEYAIDHIQALDHLGAHALENWQLLCRPCHVVKTGRDVKASAKGRRLRGEVGNGPKRAIASRNTLSHQPELMATSESRGPKSWQRAPEGYVSPLSKKSKSYRNRGFGK